VVARKFLKRSRACIILLSAALAACPACVKLPRRATAVAASTQALAEGAKLVSINRATREELETLPGVGPALAARIVEQRERYGPFRRAEHLMLVRGISERRFLQLRPFVSAD
jgi:competence protein ComEA